MGSSNVEISLARFRALDGKELEVVGFAERASVSRPDYVVTRHRSGHRCIGTYPDRHQAEAALTADFGPLRRIV